ncbi:hypothetical protein [Fodinicola feengrottensis]|uniref:hypothetical protein n=1 Tax=Fodinicola feengrottensis TaxID=435914 RepID=UPI0031D2B0C6
MPGDSVNPEVTLQRHERRTLGQWDVVELHPGVQLIRGYVRGIGPPAGTRWPVLRAWSGTDGPG